MTWLTGVMVYVVIWWMVLLMVLPWGVKVPEIPEPGHATSAPQNPMMWRKALITTLISAVLWGIAYWLIESEWLSLRPPRGGP
jgi:predicted secreted protein